MEIILYKNNSKIPFSLNKLGAVNTVDNKVFNASLFTVVFMYGYTSTDEKESSVEMREAYALLESITNFLIVNTSVVFGGEFLNVSNYEQAAQMTVCVGRLVAAYLAELRKLGVSEDKIHVIGHSLGGQAAHTTGERFLNITGVKVHRITGLDPAGPCFDPCGDQQLNKNDATYVDIFHTNAGIAGTNMRLGHADFFPNGGRIQPGCNDINFLSCSHNRCSHLYNESVWSGNCIYAPSPFIVGYLTSTNDVGLAVNSGYRWNFTEGVFEAKTNDVSPFCRGVAGINLGG